MPGWVRTALMAARSAGARDFQYELIFFLKNSADICRACGRVGGGCHVLPAEIEQNAECSLQHADAPPPAGCAARGTATLQHSTAGEGPPSAAHELPWRSGCVTPAAAAWLPPSRQRRWGERVLMQPWCLGCQAAHARMLRSGWRWHCTKRGVANQTATEGGLFWVPVEHGQVALRRAVRGCLTRPVHCSHRARAAVIRAGLPASHDAVYTPSLCMCEGGKLSREAADAAASRTGR